MAQLCVVLSQKRGGGVDDTACEQAYKSLPRGYYNISQLYLMYLINLDVQTPKVGNHLYFKMDQKSLIEPKKGPSS